MRNLTIADLLRFQATLPTDDAARRANLRWRRALARERVTAVRARRAAERLEAVDESTAAGRRAVAEIETPADLAWFRRPVSVA